MLTRVLENQTTILAARSENLNLLQVVPSEHRLDAARGLYTIMPRATITALIKNCQLNTLRQLVDEQQPELTRNHLQVALTSGLTEAVSYLLLNNVPLHVNDLDLAASSGSVELIEYLTRVSLRPTERAIELAARHGQVAMVQYLIERGVEPTTDALVGGAIGGRVDILEHLYQVLTRDPIPTNPDDPDVARYNLQPGQLIIPRKAFDKAAKYGHLAVLQWLFEHDGRKMSVQEYNQELEDDRLWTLYDVAYGSGHQEVVEWLVAQGVPTKPQAQALEYAFKAVNGQVIIELFDEHFDWITDVITVRIEEYVHQLIRGNCFEVLALLNEKSGYEYITTTILRSAAEQGRVDVIRWASDHLKYLNDDDLVTSVSSVEQVSTLVELLGVLRSKNITNRVHGGPAAENAARIGNRALLKYIFDMVQDADPILDPTMVVEWDTVAQTALQAGHYSLVEDLIQWNRQSFTDWSPLFTEVVWKLIEKDYVNSLDYLHRQGVTIPSRAARYALNYGSLQVAIYLLRLGYRFDVWYETPVIELIKLLYEQLGLPTENVVGEYILRNYLTAVEFLASHGYQFITEHITTVVRYHRFEILKVLYRYGIRATTLNLNEARWRGDQRIVQFLEKHGVDEPTSYLVGPRGSLF